MVCFGLSATSKLQNSMSGHVWSPIRVWNQRLGEFLGVSELLLWLSPRSSSFESVITTSFLVIFHCAIRMKHSLHRKHSLHSFHVHAFFVSFVWLIFRFRCEKNLLEVFLGQPWGLERWSSNFLTFYSECFTFDTKKNLTNIWCEMMKFENIIFQPPLVKLPSNFADNCNVFDRRNNMHYFCKQMSTIDSMTLLSLSNDKRAIIISNDSSLLLVGSALGINLHKS